MVYFGLMFQCVKEVGYGRQGIDCDDVQEIFDFVKVYVEVGVFLFVFEYVLVNFVKQVIEVIDILIIGIGVGFDCDGQVFVVDDVVGMSDCILFFVIQFGDVKLEMEKVVGVYWDVVEVGEFLVDEYSYVEDDFDELY